MGPRNTRGAGPHAGMGAKRTLALALAVLAATAHAATELRVVLATCRAPVPAALVRVGCRLGRARVTVYVYDTCAAAVAQVAPCPPRLAECCSAEALAGAGKAAHAFAHHLAGPARPPPHGGGVTLFLKAPAMWRPTVARRAERLLLKAAAAAKEACVGYEAIAEGAPRRMPEGRGAWDGELCRGFATRIGADPNGEACSGSRPALRWWASRRAAFVVSDRRVAAWSRTDAAAARDALARGDPECGVARHGLRAVADALPVAAQALGVRALRTCRAVESPLYYEALWDATFHCAFVEAPGVPGGDTATEAPAYVVVQRRPSRIVCDDKCSM